MPPATTVVHDGGRVLTTEPIAADVTMVAAVTAAAVETG